MTEIRIKVTPNKKKEGVNELRDGRLSVSVRADRKEGQANARAIQILAAHLKIPEEKLSIRAGHTSPTKTIWIK